MTRASLGIALVLVATGCDGSAGRIDFGDRNERITRDAAAPELAIRRRTTVAERGPRGRRLPGLDRRAALPDRAPQLVKGGPAFAVLPLGKDWGYVGWRAVKVVRFDRQSAVVSPDDGGAIPEVPLALVVPQARRPHAGDVVRVPAGRELPYGVVEQVHPKGVDVLTSWLGVLRKVTCSADEVMVIDGTSPPGAPVVFTVNGLRRLGTLAVEDGKLRWVVGPDGVMQALPWNDVRPYRLGVSYRPGDQLLAPRPLRLQLVTVVRALDRGLRYEVAWNETERDIVSFDQLAPP